MIQAFRARRKISSGSRMRGIASQRKSVPDESAHHERCCWPLVEMDDSATGVPMPDKKKYQLSEDKVKSQSWHLNREVSRPIPEAFVNATGAERLPWEKLCDPVRILTAAEMLKKEGIDTHRPGSGQASVCRHGHLATEPARPMLHKSAREAAHATNERALLIKAGANRQRLQAYRSSPVAHIDRAQLTKSKTMRRRWATCCLWP